MITRTGSKTRVTLFVLVALFGISAYGVTDFTSMAAHATPSAPEANFLMVLGFGLIGLGVLPIRK